jgi:thiosulfate/3-mercaptopyruvate sulfurtransferase
MKRNILVVGVLFMITLATKAQNVIVSPQWLNDNMGDSNLVIIQPSFLKLDYDNEHIKGARYLWPDWLTANSPEGTYNPPDPKAATKVLQDLGINKNSKIVLCHAFGDVSITARMFITLENLGLRDRVYYLNGGLVAWKKAGFPVTKELPVVKKGDFIATSSAPLLSIKIMC